MAGANNPAMGTEDSDQASPPPISLETPPSPRRTALTIALTYALLGGLWILFSDIAVQGVATSAAQLSTLQTLKGWIFIGGSAGLIYWLVLRSHRRITAANEDLQAAIHQVSILHRILRHNLRNICTVIGGGLSELEAHVDEDGRIYVSMLTEQNDRLISLSRKSHHLRNFLTEAAETTWVYDIAEIAATEVAKARKAYPDVSIHLDSPESANVRGYRYLAEAIEELLENAVEHNDAPNPIVVVTIRGEGDWMTLTVEDNGPGIPEDERAVLDQQFETQLDHSTGLGLWLVQLTVEESGGDLRIEDRESGGSRVLVNLPTADV